MPRRPKRTEQGPPSMEGSWRIVEGEHDSFDTSIAPLSQGLSDGASFRSPPSSGSALPSQLSTLPSDGSFARGPVTSQGGFSFSSQDSIRDFSRYEGDENLILREPFKPSLRGQTTGQGSAEMQLRMPMVDVFPSGRATESTSPSDRHQQRGMRQRFPSWTSRRRGRPHELPDSSNEAHPTNTRASSVALRILRWPVAVLLTSCLLIGLFSVSPGFQPSLNSGLLSPICRLHGLSPISLPFCPPLSQTAPCSRRLPPVEFQDLIRVQDGFGRVLERNAHLASLARDKQFFLYLVYELRRQVSMDDELRQHEVAAELNRYIELARSLTQHLHEYDVKIGHVIDSIANYERWTFRQVALIQSPPGDEAEDLMAASGGILTWWTKMWPFQPSGAEDQETRVRNAYTQLATHMSLEIGTLISIAEAAALCLEKAEKVLEDTAELLADPSTPARDYRESVLARMWARLFGNTKRAKLPDDPRVLLRRAIMNQNLVARVVADFVTLPQAMQTDINELRDKARQHTQSAVSDDFDGAGHESSERCDGTVQHGTSLPRQLDVLKAGHERLEATKIRMRGNDYGKPRIALQDEGKTKI